MREDPFTTSLPCKLSAEEYHEFSADLARKTQEHINTQGQAKQVAAQYAATLKRIAAEMAELASTINSGQIMKPVKVKWEYHWDQDVKDLIRLDTFDLVRTEPITTEERQGYLFEKEQARKGDEKAEGSKQYELDRDKKFEPKKPRQLCMPCLDRLIPAEKLSNPKPVGYGPCSCGAKNVELYEAPDDIETGPESESEKPPEEPGNEN